MNFILRTVTPSKEGLVFNTSLGDHYARLDRDRHPVEFHDAAKLTNNESEKIFGFVVCKDGSKTIPLYSGKEYFIMTESGTTFERIT